MTFDIKNFNNQNFITKMSIIVGGKNDYKQILQKTDKAMITSPFSIKFEFNDVSLSIYNDHALSIGEDHVPYAIGNNTKYAIHPEKSVIFKKFYGLHTFPGIKDEYTYESAVTGQNYSLYLISGIKKSKKRNFPSLIYVLGDKKICKFSVLNTQGYKIISIYGGAQISAAIDECGSIHIITGSIFDDPNRYTRVTWLPEGDLPVYIAFEGESILALSGRGYLYEYLLSDFDICDYFHPVKEMIGIQCVSLSGISSHCLVCALNGNVFGRGSNESKQLGVESDSDHLNEFVRIDKLLNKKIESVFAGDFHSFFVDDAGALYACGSNKFGEVMIKEAKLGQNIEWPTLTNIKKDVKFVIASTNLSVVFTKNPPISNSNKKIILASPYPYPLMLRHDSNDMTERLRNLEEVLKERNDHIDRLKKFIDYLTKSSKANADKIVDADTVDDDDDEEQEKDEYDADYNEDDKNAAEDEKNDDDDDDGETQNAVDNDDNNDEEEFDNGGADDDEYDDNSDDFFNK